MNTFISLLLAIVTLAIIAVGLLAGILLDTGMDQYTCRSLPERSWTEQHQAVDALFRKVMPVFFNTTALLLIVAAIVANGTARWLFASSAVLTILSIAISVAVEVPMNRAVAGWIPGAAPSDWWALRDRWL
jgi:uncharacterized membrane protein